MKEMLLLTIAMFAMVIGIRMAERNKLTKEQNEILMIYCRAMPECRKEIEK